MPPATKSRTGRAMSEHAHQGATISTAAAAQSSAALMSSGGCALPASYPPMPAEKMERILKYLDDQLCLTQESLPIADASYESLVGKSQSPAGLHVEVNEELPLSRRQKDKRAGRKRLSMLTGRTRPPEESAQTCAQAGHQESGSYLASIRGLPASATDRQKHLGIFNKGKAVASHSAGKQTWICWTLARVRRPVL
ncbi:hypothetical protein GGH92_009959, partial [Coemansia sp. RSA 2673]